MESSTMFHNPKLKKTHRRKVVYVEVDQIDPDLAMNRYDVVRCCCRYENGRVCLSVFPGFDVRPLARGADLPCDSDGAIRTYTPRAGWTDEETEEWGIEFQAGLLDDIRERRLASVAWEMVRDVCYRNRLVPKPKKN